MNLLVFGIIMLGVAVMALFAIGKPVLFNKRIPIKRLNPAQVVKEGDFAFTGNAIQIRSKWVTKTFQLLQVTSIRLHGRTGLGNGIDAKKNIEIEFEDGTTALLSTRNKDHQKISDDILLALGQSKVDWAALLPVNSHKTFLYKAPLRFY